MVIAWILLAIVAVILGAGIVGNFLWSCSLADREDKIERHEVALETREDALKVMFFLQEDKDDERE